MARFCAPIKRGGLHDERNPDAKSSSSRRSAPRSGAATRRRATTRTRTRTSCSGKTLHRGDRARRASTRRGGRGRDRRLRAAVRRADVQRRPQRLAAGRAADRDAGHDGRPPVRLGPAGRQLRRGADRRRRARRRDRRRASSTWATSRWASASSGPTRSASPWPPELLRALQPRPPGHLGRDDRRQVGDPALGARRARACARTSSPHQATEEGRFEREIDPVPGQRRHLRDRPGHPPRHDAGGARGAQAGLQARRQDHRRQLVADLRRRRRGAADERARRPTQLGSSRARGSSTRRPSASTR